MSRSPQVAYYAWVENQRPAPFARLVESGFFSCILVPLDAGIMEKTGSRIGASPTAAALIVDLGDASVIVAKDILGTEPRLRRKLFLIGSKSKKIAVPAGATLISPASIVQAVRAAVQ